MSKRDLTGYVRYDGSGRVVAGSLILRKKMPKVGRWKAVDTYDCCVGVNDAVTPFQMQTVGAVDSPTACALEADTVIYYHNGTGATPVVGNAIYTDAAGTTLLVGTGAFHHSTSTAATGETYEISALGIVTTVTAC